MGSEVGHASGGSEWHSRKSELEFTQQRAQQIISDGSFPSVQVCDLAMTLRCFLLGHRRSRSCATLDERQARWISECKRCRIPMGRDPDGRWHVTPPVQAGKLVPVERESGSSAASSGSSAESPLASAAAVNPPDGRRRRATKNSEKPVELSAS